MMIAFKKALLKFKDKIINSKQRRKKKKINLIVIKVTKSMSLKSKMISFLEFMMILKSD